MLQQLSGHWTKKREGSKNDLKLYSTNISQVTHVVEMDRDYTSGGNYPYKQGNRNRESPLLVFDFPETLIWAVKLPVYMSLS